MAKIWMAGLVLAVGMGGAAALAETTADNAIKYRKATMKAVGGHMGASAAVVKGEAGQASDLAVHARGLAMSASVALEAFRQNTDGQGGEKTTALPKIWTDWSDFEGKMNDFVTAANAFADKAEAGSVTGADLGEVGKTCKGCHDDYREKK